MHHLTKLFFSIQFLLIVFLGSLFEFSVHATVDPHTRATAQVMTNELNKAFYADLHIARKGTQQQKDEQHKRVATLLDNYGRFLNQHTKKEKEEEVCSILEDEELSTAYITTIVPIIESAPLMYEGVDTADNATSKTRGKAELYADRLHHYHFPQLAFSHWRLGQPVRNTNRSQTARNALSLNAVSHIAVNVETEKFTLFKTPEYGQKLDMVHNFVKRDFSNISADDVMCQPHFPLYTVLNTRGAIITAVLDKVLSLAQTGKDRYAADYEQKDENDEQELPAESKNLFPYDRHRYNYVASFVDMLSASHECTPGSFFPFYKKKMPLSFQKTDFTSCPDLYPLYGFLKNAHNSIFLNTTLTKEIDTNKELSDVLRLKIYPALLRIGEKQTEEQSNQNVKNSLSQEDRYYESIGYTYLTNIIALYFANDVYKKAHCTYYTPTWKEWVMRPLFGTEKNIIDFAPLEKEKEVRTALNFMIRHYFGASTPLLYKEN